MTSPTKKSGKKQKAQNTQRAGWWRRILPNALAIVIVLSLLGVTYQTVATQNDIKKYPMPGQLIDVGGYRLHLYCTGKATDGNPTVILEQGLGGTTPAWGLIQPEVAKVTRVCAYDRAGMGWSDPALKGTQRDGQQIVKDLHTLLQKANISGPYVMVGWSFGGLYTRIFAHQYPEEVAGMVLLDSSHPDQWSTTAGQEMYKSNLRFYSISSTMARFGLIRLRVKSQATTGLPDLQQKELLAFYSATQDWDAQAAEFKSLPQTNRQVNASGSFGDIPLIVLSAIDHGMSKELEQNWQDWQNQLAQLSTNSYHQILDRAHHESLWADPQFASESVAAILKVVNAVETGKLLPSLAPL